VGMEERKNPAHGGDNKVVGSPERAPGVTECGQSFVSERLIRQQIAMGIRQELRISDGGGKDLRR
jgi:hypothetical protein